MNSITRSKVKEGVYWTICTNVVLTFLKVIIISILARLIDPKFFGLNAILLIIINFSTVFTIPFLNKNILLSKKNDLINESILISLIHSLIIFLILIVTAPFVQRFYNEIDGLTLYIQIGVVLVPLMSLNNVLTTVFVKKMDYKWISIRKISTNIIAIGITPVVLSYYFDLNHWALLIGLILKELLDISLMILKTKVLHNFTLPQLSKVKLVYQNIFSITFTEVINKIALNGDYFVISKFIGANALGLYSKSYELLTLPVRFISEALNNVGLSSLALESKNNNLQVEVLKKIYFLLSISTFPMGIFLFYSSDLIIEVFLGDKWKDAADVFKIFSIALFFRIAYKVPGMILQLRREFKTILYSEIIYATLIVLLSFFFKGYGIEAIAIGVIISILIQFNVLTILICRKLYIKPKIIYSAFLKPFSISLSAIIFIEISHYFFGVIFFEFYPLKVMLSIIFLLAMTGLLLKKYFISS
jgi:O-antigen/teichoic acid export membrane protein